MPKHTSMSQIRSKLRQQQNKVNRVIRNYERGVKRAVNQYNQAARQHNTRVLHNRAQIEAEIRRLNSSNSVRATSYRASVSSLNTAYHPVARIYDNLESGSQFQEYIYSGIEQENANNLTTANVVLEGTEPDDEYSLQDTQIMNHLENISADLSNRWKGALFSLSPKNPDATRHFCTSAREIFTEIFDLRASDNEVFAAIPNCPKTDRGNATRKSKIRFFLQRKGIIDESVTTFINEDIENILELFHTLSDGTHGEAGRYSINQLSVIKKRVEDGLNFLCDIVA